MVLTPAIKADAAVIDANVLIAICAKEATKYATALAQINTYIQNGTVLYAPGVAISETLYILCNKFQQGYLTLAEHTQAIRDLVINMAGILPPPSGDAALIARAEQIRGSYGCSRSADGLYIALAEELALTGTVELVTFDAGLQKQAAANAPAVAVTLLVI